MAATQPRPRHSAQILEVDIEEEQGAAEPTDIEVEIQHASGQELSHPPPSPEEVVVEFLFFFFFCLINLITCRVPTNRECAVGKSWEPRFECC